MRHFWKISGKQLQKECNFVVIVITICNWKLQIFFILTIEHDIIPSAEFEPTHCQLTLKLMESSFWGHLVHSEPTRWAHAVSLLWVCNSHGELSVSYLWTHYAVVAVNSLWELQIHGKLSASSQCELILWVHCELTECPQNEHTMR